MLDKDFDALFKSSFEDYEVAPAAESWTKISDKINVKPKQKKFRIFWMAAASIIIVMGIGIGLYTKPTAVIKLHPDGETEMMANLAQEQKPNSTAHEVQNIVRQSTKKQKVKFTKVDKVKDETVAQNIVVEESTTVDEPIVTELTAVRTIKTVRPKLVTEQLLAQEEIGKFKKRIPVMLAKEDPVIANTATFRTSPTKRLRILSVGDLVNFVVAKVDKRDEKIIKMAKTDESDNEITGINLGLIKFSKRD